MDIEMKIELISLFMLLLKSILFLFTEVKPNDGICEYKSCYKSFFYANWNVEFYALWNIKFK